LAALQNNRHDRGIRARLKSGTVPSLQVADRSQAGGAGALFDFGCCGLIWRAVDVDNQRPLSVMRSLSIQADCIRVDDEARSVLAYQSSGDLQASWN